jgi:hypothetical protein
MNGPRVYVTTGRRPVLEIPGQSYFIRRDSVDSKIRVLKAHVRAGRVDYLVYFDLDQRDGVVTPQRLAESGITLHKIADHRDGELWKVSGVS